MDPTSPTPVRDPGRPGPTDWSRVEAPGGGPRSGLRVAAIFGRTFWAWWRDLPAYAFLSALAAVPGAWGTYVLYGRHAELLRAAPSAVDPFEPFRQMGRIYGRLGPYLFAGLVCLAILAGAVVHGASRRLGEKRAGLGELVAVGLQRSFAMFAMFVLVLVAGFGTLCLVVVPVILWCGWAVAAPAVAVEGAGPIRALGRSWGLTQGHRWTILGGVALVYLVCLAATFTLQAVITGRLLGADPFATVEELRALALPMAIHQIAAGIVGTPLLVVTAVIHHQLRALKEGGDPAQLAHVFE